MTHLQEQIADMVGMLPEQDQNLAFELVKKLVLAWDPDYVKVTPKEAASIQQGEHEIAMGETVSHDEIDWNN